MIPKVGDLVRMNPEYLQKASAQLDPLHPVYGLLMDIHVWGMGILRVSEVIQSAITPGYVSVYFEGTWHSVGIWESDGRFYASPVGSPPLLLLTSDGIPSRPEPHNNDGRGECFWCPGIKTDKHGGGLYDVCPKCGR
jgi:hypothetical protein